MNEFPGVYWVCQIGAGVGSLPNEDPRLISVRSSAASVVCAPCSSSSLDVADGQVNPGFSHGNRIVGWKVIVGFHVVGEKVGYTKLSIAESSATPCVVSAAVASSTSSTALSVETSTGTGTEASVVSGTAMTSALLGTELGTRLLVGAILRLGSMLGPSLGRELILAVGAMVLG